MREDLFVGQRVLFRTPDKKVMEGTIKSISGNQIEIDDDSITWPSPLALSLWAAMVNDQSKNYNIKIQRPGLN